MEVSSPRKDAPQPTFFMLPLELREIIYFIALLKPDTHIGTSVYVSHVVREHDAGNPAKYWDCWFGRTVMTGLFRANKQVSAEALRVFFSKFTFRLGEGAGEPRGWLNCVNKLSLANLIFVEVTLRANMESGWIAAHDENKKLFRRIATDMPNLYVVQVRIQSHWDEEGIYGPAKYDIRSARPTHLEKAKKTIASLLYQIERVPRVKLVYGRPWSLYSPKIEEAVQNLVQEFQEMLDVGDWSNYPPRRTSSRRTRNR